ncbi:hypothetical protein HYT00_03175 [Candidatus Giovannonibacteria bacterium]|nr:hypothetical protein [Candidatus Giovannonibacteria bacterium]
MTVKKRKKEIAQIVPAMAKDRLKDKLRHMVNRVESWECKSYGLSPEEILFIVDSAFAHHAIEKGIEQIAEDFVRSLDIVLKMKENLVKKENKKKFLKELMSR